MRATMRMYPVTLKNPSGVGVADLREGADDEKRRIQYTLVVVVWLFLWFVGLSAYAGGTTDLIATTGAASGTGGVRFTRFGVPVINDAGQVAFRATISENNRKLESVYAARDRNLTEVVRGLRRAPDGNGLFEYFSTPLFNTAGDAAFWIGLIETRGIAKSTDDEGVFLSRNGRIFEIVREGRPAPYGRGTVEGFLSYDFNDAGTTSFLLSTKRDGRTEWAVYTGGETGLTQIAAQDAQAPHGFGRFTRFSGPTLNDTGDVAFTAVTTSAVGEQNTHSGVYKGSGGPLTQIARVGTSAADGEARFSGFTESMINRDGDVVFIARLSRTEKGAGGGSGVFRGAGGPVTRIVRAGQPAPDGNGVFADFKAPLINDAGAVAVAAYFRDTKAGVSDDSGIFFGDGESLIQIAREGEPTGQDALFSEIDSPALNNVGVVAFDAVLVPADGRGVTRRAIFLADGRELIPAVRTGDTAAGSTITAVRYRGYSRSVGRRGLNDLGQVAYQASLASGEEGVFLFTPPLRWRVSRSGHWDQSSNWTLGLLPGSVHEVSIAPAHDLTVTAPADSVSVKRLIVGGGGGTAKLSLNAGTIHSRETVEIANRGILTGAGVIDAGVVNHGTVQGLRNSDGRGNDANGSRLLFTRDFVNEVRGRIDLAGATLRVDGGLINKGNLRISQGAPQLIANLVNNGHVHISDGARVTFQNLVWNNTEFYVDSGAQALFQAGVTGAGTFSGFGGVVVEGSLSPGGGASLMTFAGDLTLGYDNVSSMELGGAGRGAGHDAVDVGGTLVLGGALEVRLIAQAEPEMEFNPEAGDTFELFRAAHITGDFRRTKLPKLRRGLRWDIRQTNTEYVLSVRPMPSAVGN